MLAAVIKDDPDWGLLPSGSVQRVIRRCLTKPMQDRLQHVGDARIELQRPSVVEVESGASRRGRLFLATTVLATAVAVWALTRPQASNNQAEVGFPPNINAHINMWYTANMAMQAIQVSMDEDLLKRIDEEPEVQERGRSAFIRSAVQLYLKAKRRHEIDDEIRRAYEGCADEMLDEVAGLVGSQAWPED